MAALFKTETRIQIIGLIFLLGLSAIIGKLWLVQVARGDFYTQKIRGQSEVTVRIPSVRGEIRDRNGVPLVTNRASYSVDFLLPEMVKGYAEAFGKKSVPKIDYVHTVHGVYASTKETNVVKIVQETVLPRLEQLGIEEDFNAKQLQVHFRNDTLVPFTYMEDIKFDEMAKLSERDLGLPGVDVTVRPVREYPYGALAAHILGYVGTADTDQEDAKNFTFYQPDVEGKNNVEQAMDKWLRGEPGARIVKRNAKGVIEGDIGVRPSVPGSNVYLTIDARVQTIAEKALRQVGRGAAIVVNPNTGDILAMASVPSFDPNQFIPSISGDDWSKLIKDDTNPLTNRAILSYAPGSTFKTITALAGLLAGKGNNRYTCSGGVSYGDHYFKCWIAAKGGQHGNLDLTDALKFSCNAYFYQYGNATGIETIDKVANFVGLGQRTGIELSNEAPGVIPGKEWLERTNPKERWSDGLTANTSIGQGDVKCSPLQMSLVASMLANGGTAYYPRLIDRVLDGNDQDVLDPETGKPVAQGPRVRGRLSDLGLQPDQIEKVRRGMWKVVNAPDGTATRAKLKNMEVAGKTGTAQFWRNGVQDNHTWFMCFAPYDKPKYAVCVFIQGAKGGGITAAPIAAEILDEAVALDEKRFNVAVHPMTPAKGSFTFIDNIVFKTDVGSASSAEELLAGIKPAEGVRSDSDNKTAADNDETSDDDDSTPPTDRNADADRPVVVATPKLKAAPDEAGRVRKPKPSAPKVAGNGGTPAVATPAEGESSPNETGLMHSMRKFFRRGGDEGDGPEAANQLKADQRDLRKQQKAQQQKLQPFQPSQSQPQATPPPKKKRFLIF